MHQRRKAKHMSEKVEEYVPRAVSTFLVDPPDTDSQWGFLSALLVVAKEALELRMDKSPFAEAQELERRAMRLEQRRRRAMKELDIEVENYFGGCPECGKLDNILNVGRDHWAVCQTHMAKWRVGNGLFSGWRTESEDVWRANSRLLDGYTEVKPLPSTNPGDYADEEYYRRAMSDPRLKRATNK